MTARRARFKLPGKAFDVAGHQLHLVQDAKDRLRAILALIEDARESVRMFFYMIEPDQTGREVLDALVAAARRGVAVRLMIDSFGSANTPHSFFDPLIAAGGQYDCFGSRWGIGYFVRNHQKILIADSKHALVGGYNITDQYFNRKGSDSWEDLGLIVSGPQAAVLAYYYDEMDALCEAGHVKFNKMRRLTRDWQPGGGDLIWLVGGPTNRISSWGLAFKQALNNAKRLDIVAAYFSPSQAILRRIAKVTRRNKGSRLIMAGKTDNNATIGAARLLYRYLLRSKAHIYEYQSRPLHSKFFIIDDIVFIGSANLDIRSLFINLEIMVRIENTDFANYMRVLVDELVAQSEEQTPALLKRRDTIWSRLQSGLAYFLVNSVDYSIGKRFKFRLLPKG
jgi:cardiolipin synthase A/B